MNFIAMLNWGKSVHACDDKGEVKFCRVKHLLWFSDTTLVKTRVVIVCNVKVQNVFSCVSH